MYVPFVYAACRRIFIYTRLHREYSSQYSWIDLVAVVVVCARARTHPVWYVVLSFRVVVFSFTAFFLKKKRFFSHCLVPSCISSCVQVCTDPFLRCFFVTFQFFNFSNKESCFDGTDSRSVFSLMGCQSFINCCSQEKELLAVVIRL